MIRAHLRQACRAGFSPGLPLALCADRFVVDES